MTTIYKGAWAVFGMVIAILVVGGLLDAFSLTILGIACFGLIFFGMMLVLPHSITHSKREKGRGFLHRLRTAADTTWDRWNPDDISIRKTDVVHHAHRSAPAKS